SRTSALEASNHAVLPVSIVGPSARYCSTLPLLVLVPSLRRRQRRPSAGCAELSLPAVSRTVSARFRPCHAMFRTCEENRAQHPQPSAPHTQTTTGTSDPITIPATAKPIPRCRPSPIWPAATSPTHSPTGAH